MSQKILKESRREKPGKKGKKKINSGDQNGLYHTCKKYNIFYLLLKGAKAAKNIERKRDASFPKNKNKFDVYMKM